MEADSSALPRGICRSCYEETVAAITFRSLCMQSTQHWMEATSYFSQIHQPTIDDKTYFFFYGNEKTLVKDQIGRAPTTEVALEKLNMKYQTKPEKIRRPKRSHDPAANCKCPDCGKSFSFPNYLNYHLRNTLKRACTQCGIVLPKKKMMKHMASEHDLIVSNCSVCHKLFDEETDLISHIKESHGVNTHCCSVCGNGYSNERALRAHLYAHSLFHCKSCSSSFENIKCYKYHQKQCKTVEQPVFKQFTCDLCGVTYNRKPSLRIHIVQKHLNVLPYVCLTCGKRTSTIAHLRSHEKIHKTQRKIFLCYCGAQLRTELGYQLHQRIHTGERPYECEFCGDRFLSSSRRLDHVKRRHRGAKEMPHGCEQCSARFVRPCELKKHYLTVHLTAVEVMPAKREINPITKRLRNTIEKQY